MDFIIPHVLLKQDKWNFINIAYHRGDSRFGIKVNKSCDDEYTKLPIQNFDEKLRCRIMLDTRSVVEK